MYVVLKWINISKTNVFCSILNFRIFGDLKRSKDWRELSQTFLSSWITRTKRKLKTWQSKIAENSGEHGVVIPSVKLSISYVITHIHTHILSLSLSPSVTLIHLRLVNSLLMKINKSAGSAPSSVSRIVAARRNEKALFRVLIEYEITQPGIGGCWGIRVIRIRAGVARDFRAFAKRRNRAYYDAAR